MIEEVRRKLEEYKEWNETCKMEAEKRHDDEAITFNDNVIYAIDKAIEIVDSVRKEHGS